MAHLGVRFWSSRIFHYFYDGQLVNLMDGLQVNRLPGIQVSMGTRVLGREVRRLGSRGRVSLRPPWRPRVSEKGGMSVEKLGLAMWRFLEREDGPTAVEYAVMLALIIVVCLTAITTLGTNANQVFSNVGLNIAAGS